MTPTGEPYAEMAVADIAVEGHNMAFMCPCLGMTTVAESEVRVRHFEESSSEAMAMSLLPYWELYHSNASNAPRLKRGITMSELLYGDETIISAAERRRLRREGLEGLSVSRARKQAAAAVTASTGVTVS